MKLDSFLLFVVFVNAYFFISQISIIQLNPDNPVVFYNYKNSMMSDFDTGNYTLNDDVTLSLPSSSSSVSASDSGIYTDTFSAIKNWLLDFTGIRYLLLIVNAVPNFLKSIGLPDGIAFALGWVWYLMSLITIISYIKGSD